MNFQDYKKEVQRTMQRLEDPKLDNIHMLFGLSTEVGELIDQFKKNLAYQKPVDWVNIQEELGDILWYLTNFMTINDIDFETTLQKNVDKLKQRYKDNFTTTEAIDRNLSAERSALQQ